MVTPVSPEQVEPRRDVLDRIDRQVVVLHGGDGPDRRRSRRRPTQHDAPTTTTIAAATATIPRPCVARRVIVPPAGPVTGRTRRGPGGTASCPGQPRRVGVAGDPVVPGGVADRPPAQRCTAPTKRARSSGSSSTLGVIGSAAKASTRPAPTWRTMAAGAPSMKRATTGRAGGDGGERPGPGASIGTRQQVVRQAGASSAPGSTSSTEPRRGGPSGAPISASRTAASEAPTGSG